MDTATLVPDRVSASAQRVVLGTVDITGAGDIPFLNLVQSPLERLTPGLPYARQVLWYAHFSVDRYEWSEPGEMTRQEIEEHIAAYEEMFGMSSDEFLRSVRDGTAPDTFETNDWRILLKYR